MERHGDFLKHLENSRSNDPWAKKNMAFKTLTPVRPHCICQFIVTSYITAILYCFYIHICHKIMLITRSYIKQLLQTEQWNIFRNAINSKSVKTIFEPCEVPNVYTPIIIQPPLVSVTHLNRVPILRAISGAMKRFDDWNQDIPAGCWNYLRALAKEQKIWESGVHDEEPPTQRWVNVRDVGFCWSGCFNWPMQWYRRVGSVGRDKETWNTRASWIKSYAMTGEKSKSIKIKPSENQ